MRKFLIIAMALFPLLSISQERGEVSLSVSKSENDMFYFTPLVGAGSHNGNGGYGVSIGYSTPLNGWLMFQTGLDFGYHTFTIEPAFVDPRIDVLAPKESMFLTSIPIGLRVNFLKYFYINAHTLIDIDFNQAQYLHDQTGLGAQLAIGFNYRFKQGFGVHLSPFLGIHSIVPFSLSNNHRRLFESGLKLGVLYKL